LLTTYSRLVEGDTRMAGREVPSATDSLIAEDGRRCAFEDGGRMDVDEVGGLLRI